MSSLIYLAGPYSYDPDQAFNLHLFYAAQLLQSGALVFSPIAHNHQLAKTHGLPSDYIFWTAHNKAILQRCDELWVMLEPGWNTSKGTQQEIEFALSLSKPILYIKVTNDSISISKLPPE